jgi:hypothetical protein
MGSEISTQSKHLLFTEHALAKILTKLKIKIGEARKFFLVGNSSSGTNLPDKSSGQFF